MNAITKEHQSSIALVDPSAAALAVVPVDNSPFGRMLAASQAGISLDQLQQMMEMQERWEKVQAEKSYNKAFAAFKAEAVVIIKNQTATVGSGNNSRKYAGLHDVVSAVTPALSKHGLSASWRLTRDEKDWIEVTCTLRHVDGHAESVSMGGMPDASGAKNTLQARASTKTYLERYTLKAICGVAESDDDNDGAGGSSADRFTLEWIEYALSHRSNQAEFDKVCKDARAAFNEARNSVGLKAFNKAVAA